MTTEIAEIQNNFLFDSTTKFTDLITNSLSFLFNKTVDPSQCPPHLIPSLISKDLVCMNSRELILDIDEYQRRLLEFEFSDEDTIRSFIEGSPPPLSTNREKIKFFTKINHKTKNTILLKILLKKIKPEFNYNDVFDIIFLHRASDYQKLIPLISPYYTPQDPRQEFDLLETLMDKLDRKDFMHFWQANRGYFSNFSLQSKAAKERTLSLALLKFLKEQGADSRLFNIPNYGRTGIQRLIREGEIEYVGKLLKEIPLAELEYGDYFFPAEIQPCAESAGLETLPPFDTKRDMIAQNGCNAVIFRQDGTTLTLPGQEAQVLFNRYVSQEQSGFLAKIFGLFQNTTSTPMDSFRIYLNSGHASLAFDSDQTHFGFYPGVDATDVGGFILEKIPSFLRKNGLRKSLKETAKTGVSSGGRSSLTHKNTISKGLKAFDSFKKFFWLSDGTAKCEVKDDGVEKSTSDATNQLTLKVFASRSQVQKVREFVEKTETDCRKGEASYAVLGSNCVDFVQRGMQSTGFKGDFRDAFTNSQMVRRFGGANLYSFAVSKGATSLKFAFPSSLSEAFDAIPRNPLMKVFKGVGATLTGYISYRTLPYVAQNIGLGASRIARISAVLFEGTLAIGRTFYRNSLFHR